jgi:hypothetical protein
VERKPPAAPAKPGLREFFVAEYAERTARPGHEEFRGHWLAELARWQSTEPVEVSAWELPAEYRPDGAEDFDQYLVGPDGGLTLVSVARVELAVWIAERNLASRRNGHPA